MTILKSPFGLLLLAFGGHATSSIAPHAAFFYAEIRPSVRQMSHSFAIRKRAKPASSEFTLRTSVCSANTHTTIDRILPSFEKCRSKMKEEGIANSAISAFESTFNSLASGATGIIPEDTIHPVPELDHTDSLTGTPDASLLARTVVVKLNGGLGTSMGLDKAKSLLIAKGQDTFLDLTAKQIIQMRKQFGHKIKFMLMNSFSTSADTLAFFEENYPELAGEHGLEMMQNKVPKLDATTLEPATCKENPEKEWCPPGHGDLYSALVGSGRLDSLIKEGYRYMFVSNSDNLGASLDLDILSYFAEKNAPFLMECCERTENDKKGGHLAVRKSDSQLVLRESAMCAEEDEDAFMDISKHRFFNTNNLWIRLDKLKETVDKHGGFVPLPMIKNEKTVDPKDETSQQVLQLETAMGAAIECFDNAMAIVVPRARFAPVKKCNDLLLLRSDAYLLQDHKPVLNPKCQGTAPVVSLDSKLYKCVHALEEAIADGIPSLARCKRLTIKGPIRLSNEMEFIGEVTVAEDGNIVHHDGGKDKEQEGDDKKQQRNKRKSKSLLVDEVSLRPIHHILRPLGALRKRAVVAIRGG